MLYAGPDYQRSTLPPGNRKKLFFLIHGRNFERKKRLKKAKVSIKFY